MACEVKSEEEEEEEREMSRQHAHHKARMEGGAALEAVAKAETQL